MSASERLKALAEAWATGEWPEGAHPVSTLDLLPQIVAVVEAAEWTSESGVYSYERHVALTTALTALDEALS